MHDLININQFLNKTIGFEDIFTRFFQMEEYNSSYPFYNIKKIDDEINSLFEKDLLNKKPYTASELQNMKIKYHKLGRYDKTGMPTLKDDINRVMGKAVRDELVDFAGKVDSPLGKQLSQELTDYSSLVTFVK